MENNLKTERKTDVNFNAIGVNEREINHSCFIFQIRPVIDKQFSFMEADKAYKKMEEGHTRGKIVLNMAQ